MEADGGDGAFDGGDGAFGGGDGAFGGGDGAFGGGGNGAFGGGGNGDGGPPGDDGPGDGGPPGGDGPGVPGVGGGAFGPLGPPLQVLNEGVPAVQPDGPHAVERPPTPDRRSPTPPFNAWQDRPVLASPDAAPVSPEGVPDEHRDGPFDPNDVHLEHVYQNAEHRHLDTLWLTRDGVLPCLFHNQMCGVFGLSCPACGLLTVCYPCRQFFVDTGRQDCPSCGRNRLLRQLYTPLF